MKLLNKILYFSFLIMGALVYAQDVPPPPSGTGRGVGPGAPASPIDMYVYVLALLAVVFIVYFTKRIQKKLA